jgi:hypothetical protein
LYGDAPPATAREVGQLVKDVTWLLAELERRFRLADAAESPPDQ